MITHSNFTHDKTRLNLYFDKYKYRFNLTIFDIHWFKSIKTRRQYLERLVRVVNDNDHNSFSDEFIRSFINWRISSDESKFIVRTHCDNVSIYTNDINVIQSLYDIYTTEELISLKPKFHYSELVQGYDKSVIYHVNPKYKYRIYLKSRRYTRDEAMDLYHYLTSKNIKIGQGLSNWFYFYQNPTGSYSRLVSAKGYWAFDHHYFDFDDDKLITMIYLKFSNTIRKVCEIHKKINT